MGRCPRCGKVVEKPINTWNLSKTYVKQYECCGKKFREYKRGLSS
ncbi:MAG: hypothetical protein NWE77_02910 [Candidatus Bathyarchaeota archaeon]|nr:hypothetical protein [Candidatus Bathyarchaeota archaeon]